MRRAIRGRRRSDEQPMYAGRRHYDPQVPGSRVAAFEDSLKGSSADNLKGFGRQDDARINVEQDHELSYWSQTFGVSRDELRSAVAKVGPTVKAVRDHLLLRD